jgi:carboxymethylenebutenolidase
MSRRDFLDRLTGLIGSAAAAAAIWPILRNNYAQAAIIAADDPRLVAERVAYDSPKGKINGYLVRPTAKGKRPAIIVIHENRGLNPHIEDVADLRSKAFWSSLRTCYQRPAAHLKTRIRRANCTVKLIPKKSQRQPRRRCRSF